MRYVSVLCAVVILAGLCSGFLSGCVTTESTAADTESFEISYSHAGLTRLDVEQNRLKYVWSMPKQNQPAMGQDQGDFSKHEFKTDLTATQFENFRVWVAKHEVFSFEAEYPPAEPKSYGSAFDSRLTILCDGRRHSSFWDNTSRNPKVKIAVGELIRLVHGVMAGK